MISRTGFIITALLLCHLFLRPKVLTSQLPAPKQQQNPAQAGNPPASNSKPAPAAEQDEDTFDEYEMDDDNPPPQQQSKPQITVKTDAGEEDTRTEQIIQQEMQESGQEELGPKRPPINVAPGRNEVLISADEQEKNQDIYYARGHVQVRFTGNTLHADQVTYDSSTGQLTATGHVVFDGGPHNEHVSASHGTYDVSRDSGTFYDAAGSTGARVKNQTMFLTSSTPFFFNGKVVKRLGPDHYRVENGFVTSCQLPKPKWHLDSKVANVEIGDEAQLHHATMRLFGMPVFYFPYVEHPADNFGRKSGFLIPAIGISNSRGTILGDGFYWVISRNSDATIGAEYYSKRGWAQLGNFRWLGFKSAFQAEYFGVIDSQGNPSTGQNQGGEEFKAIGWKELPYGFHGVLNVDYLSSYIFRLAFAQGFTEAINSEVRSYGFVNKNWNGYDLGFLGSSYQNYESTIPGDYIQIVHAPSMEFSTAERQFSRSNFVYAYDTALEAVSRNEIGFETSPLVGRIDAAPYIAWPKLFRGWTFRPEIGGRETFYTERLLPSGNVTSIGTAVNDPINRNVGNASFEVRPPTLSKIFNRKVHGDVLKHTVDPYVVYRYQSGIDNFSQIIRFDYRDILADTNEVEYGIVNRLYAKKSNLSAQCYKDAQSSSQSEELTPEQQKHRAQCVDQTPPAGNVIEWRIAQKYFTNTNFGGALVPGQRNVFDTTVDFTGIAFLTEPRLFSPIISRLRMASGAADFQWDLDYDPVLHQVNASTIFTGYRWGNWYLNAGQTYLDAPGEITIVNGVATQAIYNQWRIGMIYGAMTKPGLSAAVSVGVDSRLTFIQAATIQANYNWDCCGVTFQYQRWALGLERNENAYRFSFSLTNVGTFGSIKRLQRLY
jgi:LPS-assembly protein